MLTETTLPALESGLRGDLIQPNSEQYDEACTIYNAMIDKHPAAVARCSDVADVITAIDFAREQKATASILGGGHSGPGLGLCDGGLVIDLSGMNGVRVDPDGQTARVEGGCTIGDLDHAAHAVGLATPAGVISTTGVGGLTLGGGHGYLTRKYGLTIDNLIEADVVLADGSLVTASESKNQDLFWALRGGGGNFGVVTSFLFKLHPVDTVVAGPTFWPLDTAADVLKWYREFLPAAPEDLYGFFAFMVIPPTEPFPQHLHGKKVCGCVWCYTGPREQAEEALQPVREFGPPIFEHIGELPYPALQSMFDQFYPPGLQWYWKGDFVKEISDEAVARHVEHGSNLPTPLSTMHLYPVDGTVHRVGKQDTAFSYRDANWSMVIVGVDSDPSNGKAMTDWARGYWKALHPHTVGGAYVNFMMEEGQDRVKATYRDNYERLVEVKNKYDPTNFFHINQNIAPDV